MFSAPLCIQWKSMFAAWIAVVTFSRAVAAESGSPAPGAEVAKEFVVFLGLDLSTELNGVSCPVVGGDGREIKVVAAHGIVRMPSREQFVNTDTSPKLGRGGVRIEGLEADRFYSPKVDPRQEAMEQQLTLAITQAQARDDAQASAKTAGQDAARVSTLPIRGTRGADAVRASANEAADELTQAVVAPSFHSSLPGLSDDNRGYDSIEVAFEISTPHSYDRTYGVLRLNVRDPSNPQLPVQTIKFFGLGDIGPKPRKVRWSQMGLPVGFKVDSYAVHVYVDGHELPTNHSSNRLDVTADEAHQFLVLRHLQENRQSSIPAEVATELRSPRLASLVDPKHRSGNVELAIDHDGRVMKIESSNGSVITITPELEAALREVRFLPALLNGKPVTSHGTFALSELMP